MQVNSRWQRWPAAVAVRNLDTSAIVMLCDHPFGRSNGVCAYDAASLIRFVLLPDGDVYNHSFHVKLYNVILIKYAVF